MTIEETSDYDYWEYELMVEELMSVLKEVDEKQNKHEYNIWNKNTIYG